MSLQFNADGRSLEHARSLMSMSQQIESLLASYSTPHSLVSVFLDQRQANLPGHTQAISYGRGLAPRFLGASHLYSVKPLAKDKLA
jgi:hypothetical protein